MSDLRGEERLVTVVFTDMRAAFDLEPATLTIRGIAELVEAFKAERAPPAQFDRMTRDHAAEPATQSEISRIQGPGSG